MSRTYRIDKLRLGDEIAVLRLHGHFEQGSSSELRAVTNWLRRKGYYNVVVNLAGVQFLNSSAAGALIIVGEELEMIGGGLQACDLSEAAWRVFESLNLQDIITVRSSEREALDTFVSLS